MLILKLMGIQSFTEKLNHINLPNTTITDIIKSLLTCVYQATENSSETTQNAANILEYVELFFLKIK
jgi:NAD+ synthase (glutamine-hydrolysing)